MTNANPESPDATIHDARTPSNFLREMIAEDVHTKKFGDAVVQTRFPPEPNGYLHIGHAKAICIDFGLADEFGGKTNLRFDDTNPEKEEQEYVDSIQEDVRWLGFEWERLCYASDYFGQLYEWALQLIRNGKAYVDDLTADEIRQHRGTLTEPGKDSPYRNRSVEENLDLFVRMKAGEFPDGSRVLRAKIDMASPNLNLRDPVMYRILHASHQRTGDEWCIYPMYDYAHGQSDSIERVTHSMCTLEFADHQPLYRWYIEQLGIFPSQQTEFDRLNITYTMLSKRKLLQLVQEKRVNGWDDPRMPTLSGLRRRGFTPEAIRAFVAASGVSRTNGFTDIEMLEHFQRDDLNRRARRAMAVLRPLKLIIDNYPAGKEELVEVANNPEDPSAGTRGVPFSGTIYIEQDDFRETPPPKYYRLSPGKEVRLRNAYFVTAQSVVKDAAGNVVEVHCTYDPASRGGNSPDGRKVKSTMHWVSAAHAISAEIRLYGNLFAKADPSDVEEGQDVLDNLNPNSLEILSGAKLEPSLANAKLEDRFQFERVGYFCLDPDSTEGNLVFNRTLPLKDAWAKIEKKAGETLSCYMDESADGANKIAYSVAAVVGTKAKWCWLEEQWRRVLRKNNIQYFRNADCVGVDGAFKHLRKNPEQVDDEDRSRTLTIRNELMNLCVDSRVTAFGITIDLSDFHSVANTPEKKEAFGGTPYYHAAAWAIARCAQHVRKHRPGDILAFGFDEHEEYETELQRVFKELKERNPDIAPQLNSIAPLDDKTSVPIQIADLFAAIVRRFSPTGQQPAEFAPLRDKGILMEVRVCGKPGLEDHLKSVGLL